MRHVEDNTAAADIELSEEEIKLFHNK